MKLNELSMRAGDLSAMSKAAADHLMTTLYDETYLADVEGEFIASTGTVKFKTGKNLALIIRNIKGEFAHLSVYVKVDDAAYVNQQYTEQKFAGNKLQIKALLLLKIKLHFSKILLGEVHSKATQSNIKNIIKAFQPSWYNKTTKEIEKFTLDNYQDEKYTRIDKPTDWILLLENTGDFSIVPTKFDYGLNGYMYSIMSECLLDRVEADALQITSEIRTDRTN